MQDKLADIKLQLQALPTHEQLFSTNNQALQRQRIQLEWMLGDISITLEQQKLPSEASFRNKLCQQKKFKLTKQITNHTAESEIMSLLDYLPDLAIIGILSQLITINDVKSLFWALADRQRIEDACYNQIRWCWENTLKCDSSYLIICDKIQGYCHNPVLCMRCILNLKGQCKKCDSKIDVAIYCRRNGYPTQCSTRVETDTGKFANCQDVKECPSCKLTYAPYEECDFIRSRDFECGCEKPMQGCVFCTRECEVCANVGCMKKGHFQTLQHRHFPNDTWPVCEDCKEKHCCASYNATMFDWDYCACPKNISAPNDKHWPQLPATSPAPPVTPSTNLWSRMRNNISSFFSKN
jgi:hypothetical protein